MRSDLGSADDAKNAKNKPVEQEFLGTATGTEWARWKQSHKAAKNVVITNIYVDYVLS